MIDLSRLGILTSACCGFALMLSGCSGSSTASPSSETPVDPPPTRASFDELAELGQQLLTESWTEEITPEANMPVSGKATYSGAVAYVRPEYTPEGLTDEEYVQYVVDNPGIVSEVDLTADFGASTIDGSFSNFQDIQLGPLAGEINVSNGTIAGSDFMGDLSGAIGPVGDIRNTTGAMGGVFAGNAADYAVGGLFLDVGEGDNYLLLDGIFTAKK